MRTFLLKTRLRSLMYVMSPSSSFCRFLENLLFLSTLHDSMSNEGTGYKDVDVLFIDLADETINSILAGLVVRIQQAICVTVQTLSGKLLLKARWCHLKENPSHEHIARCLE